jgi:lysophosphatidylcholine acyltransferase / lyso-PAF acetyltransferase
MLKTSSENIILYSNEINPFQRKENPSLYNKIKKIILSITILPIRIILVSSTLIIQNLYCRLALLGHPSNTPLPRWRILLLFPARLLTRFMLFVMGFYWIKTKGVPAKKEVAPIFVGNHLSPFEGFYMAYSHFTTTVCFIL